MPVARHGHRGSSRAHIAATTEVRGWKCEVGGKSLGTGPEGVGAGAGLGAVSSLGRGPATPAG